MYLTIYHKLNYLIIIIAMYNRNSVNINIVVFFIKPKIQ